MLFGLKEIIFVYVHEKRLRVIGLDTCYSIAFTEVFNRIRIFRESEQGNTGTDESCRRKQKERTGPRLQLKQCGKKARNAAPCQS